MREIAALVTVGVLLGTSLSWAQPAPHPPAPHPAAPPHPTAPHPPAPPTATDAEGEGADDEEVPPIEDEEEDVPEPAEPVEPAEGEPSAAEPGALDNVTDPALLPDPAAEAEAAASDQPPSEGLSEVVVTVDRRRKDLQRYSGTAAAFSEQALSRIGVRSARELGAQVPGLQIGNQEGNTEVYIRGVGSDNNTGLGDPGVALHLDSVYLPRPRGMGAMFFDLERVEVNSGPQGTLRGRNALGGSINIVTHAPELGEYQTNAEATFGTFNLRRYQGMFNVPFGETLALRVAAFSEVHDPYWENAGPFYTLKGAESSDTYALRAQAKWQPTSAFSVLLGYDLTRERGTGWLGANFQGALTRVDNGGTPTDPSDDVPRPLDPDSIENPRRIYQRGVQSGVDLKHQGWRAQFNYDVGEFQVEALASYRDLEFEQVNGSNAGLVYPGFVPGPATADNYGGSYWNQPSQSWVAEIRAFAPDNAQFRWTTGAFFFKEDQQTFLGQTTDLATGYGGGEFTMPSTKGRSIAGYADATLDVADDFRLLGGVRLTQETKSRSGGLWAQWNGFPGSGAAPVRFGTEGFAYQGNDRNLYLLPPDDTVTDRVNLFLDGIRSFGARDTVPQYLCADPPAPEPGEAQAPRLSVVDGHFRCAFGVSPALVAQDEAFRADSRNPEPFAIRVVPQNNSVANLFFDWRVGAEYDAAKDSLLYVTVSTGHKAGGFNDTAYITQLYNSSYRPESLIAVELGSKNLLLDRRLRVNAAAFFYRYTDQVFQTIVAVTPPDEEGMGGSNTAVRQNAANSNVLGLDFDATYGLPYGFEAQLHALIMNARFAKNTVVNDSRIGFDVPEYPVDIAGNWLPRVSPLTLNYSLSQFYYTEVGSFDWVVSGQTRTSQYQTVFNGEGNLLRAIDGRVPTDANGNVLASYAALQANPARLTDIIPSYTRFDLGAGWRHPDGRFSIHGFVNNVTNATFPTSIIATPGLNLRFFNTPRTAGIRARVDW
jgi:iron complex outermembrane recepter protein